MLPAYQCLLDHLSRARQEFLHKVSAPLLIKQQVTHRYQGDTLVR